LVNSKKRSAQNNSGINEIIEPEAAKLECETVEFYGDTFRGAGLVKKWLRSHPDDLNFVSINLSERPILLTRRSFNGAGRTAAWGLLVFGFGLRFLKSDPICKLVGKISGRGNNWAFSQWI
jgi:hypothetical protein